MTRAFPREPRRIVCVGNRYVPGDDAGPRVHDALVARDVPDDTAVVDGGLMGLDLLAFVEGARQVVFVDSVSGFGQPGQIVVGAPPDLGDLDAGFGHHGGLGCLLKLIPSACVGPAPEILVVGIEGPADDGAIARAADRCLAIVSDRVGAAANRNGS